ncbi:unnamed protein product [Linum tenue]|uniref:Uncharacterized protein n=1 Tax=Linum tenue TaxID=586396 RepID=A0AAV0PXI5_9ROSI|nr:unnamed protein product [Linum tenue]
MLHRARFVLKNWLLHSDSSCLSGRVNACLFLSCLRLFSSDPTAPVPFAVFYLINECGVRPESTASAGKYIHFETPERADVVLGFFRNLGFTDSQLPKVFGRHPRLLVSDPDHHTSFPGLGFWNPTASQPPTLLKSCLELPRYFTPS